MDPRLSTVQNVARALDLELMLVPRQLIPLVEGLGRADGVAPRPMYALDEGEEHSEVSGDEVASHRRRRGAKGRH